METNQIMYIKVLLWAFEQNNGFTEEDLFIKFPRLKNISQDGLYSWYVRTFRTGVTEEIAFIVKLEYRWTENGGRMFYCLGPQGTVQAVHYLEMKNTQHLSEQAIKNSLWAIAIGVIVSGVEIYLQFFKINDI